MKTKMVIIWAALMLSLGTLAGKGAVDSFVPYETDSLSQVSLLSSTNMDPYTPITPVSRQDPLRAATNIIDPQDRTPAFQNIFDMIQGRVPGVRVYGSSMNYQIRVRGSLRPPLVVIDGMRFFGYDDEHINNLLLSIAPADVDYIEVIRNIGAAYLYGPGSSNGVIRVQTKRGEVQ